MWQTTAGLPLEALVKASLENFQRLAVGTDDSSWAQPPEPQTQAVGDSLAVVVTHMQSPGEMVVQKVENASKRRESPSQSCSGAAQVHLCHWSFWFSGAIQEVQVRLREHCGRLTVPQNFRPAPGTVCCAQFSGTARHPLRQSITPEQFPVKK